MLTQSSLKISVVTPNYNYARFIEGALQSVLGQDYPNFEYIVIDDGSTDDSVEIIKRYADQLTHWQTGTNQGQYHAISRGLEQATGEILCWLNSDDAYLPGALSVVADVFAHFPQIEWLTTLYPLHWDERRRLVRADQLRGFSRRGFFAGEHLPSSNGLSLGYIQQESTFWRRSLWERAGGFDFDFARAGDFALWARFFQESELYGLAAPLAGFRLHGAQLTSRNYDEYHGEARRVLQKYGGRTSGQSWRLAREIAVRFPTATHRHLERLNLMHRSWSVRWNLARSEWELKPCFI